MKKIAYILFLSILFGNYCFAKDIPSWINNPSKECSKNEICSTGNGATPNIAKTDARNNILKYFETKIESSFKSSLSTDEITVKSLKSEDVEELSNGILKGVDIKNTYEKDGEYYAFAVLDKNIAIKEIKNDIEKADSKMKLLIAENNIKYNKQLENLYIKREELNKRYLVLTGNMMPEVVKYEDIFNAKKKSGELSLTYYFKPSDGYEQEIINFLSNKAVESGAKMTDKESEANRVIVLTINKANLYLNVNGFIKQKYVLKIDVNNKSNETVSTLYQEFIETGRSDSQILEIVNMRMEDYISENMEQVLQ